MLVLCKHCGNNDARRDGFMKGNQRYRCKGCNRTFCCGDKREKYTIEQKIKAIKMYTEGVGLRSIARLEGIPAPLLVHWIRRLGKMVKQHIIKTPIPEDAKEIDILEIDELFTYYQKKHKKPMFGLLWTEAGIKLLIS
jgi:transposase-like protein